MKTIIRIMLTIAAILYSMWGYTQAKNRLKVDTGNVYRVYTYDGSILIGKAVAIKNDTAIFNTTATGITEISLSKVEKVKLLEATGRKNFFWFPNPNPTKYFLSPSAYNLKAGEVYLQNTYVSLNSINIGVTDFLSIGAGIDILSSLFSSGSDPVYFLTTKAGFKAADKLNIGGGFLYSKLPGKNNRGKRYSANVLYGVTTYGNTNHNITLGAGADLSKSDYSGRPIITMGGMLRVGRNLSLITENWIIPQRELSQINYYSGGIRIFWEHINMDFGILTDNKKNSEDFNQFLPYVDFGVKF